MTALLDSSAVCFWLKQYSNAKGSPVPDQIRANESWAHVYEFTSSRLAELPIPSALPLEFGRALDELATKMTAVEPSTVCAAGVPMRERLDAARIEYEHIRRRMIALQEHLDWDVYRCYGLLNAAEAAELITEPGSVPELELGQRAFEIVLARKVKAGQADTQWFARHGSRPITEVPEHWPRRYRDVVAKRIETIERRQDIGLIERPECKRRWQSEPWEKKERAALRNWLLERCEDRDLWYVTDDRGSQQPRPMTVNQLADQLRGDAGLASVARLFSGPDADLTDVLKEIVADEHVPFLAAFRYSASGLLKRHLWEQTWDQQREEDLTGHLLGIDAPPKYKKEDFLKVSFWDQRGKFDVPKERFISYPIASPDNDDSLLLGWAGWDHRERAHALIALIEERSSTEGRSTEKLIPLLAGLLEIVPWVQQWHNEIDPAYGTSAAQEYAMYLRARQEECNLSDEKLHTWRPPRSNRGRPRKIR